MIPPHFEYARPNTLSEALAILKGSEGAKVVSGGQSLIPLMKLRLASPTLLVDINRIPGLDYIRESEGAIRIGALTRVADLESSRLLKEGYPIIHDAASLIADPLVRNMGTIGGNVSHGDPANDLPAVMLALGAEFVVAGPSGERITESRSFFVDTFLTALAHDEILTEVRVPAAPPRSGGSYQKLEQKVADFATVGVAVQLTLNPRNVCESAGIGLTAVGPTAIKAEAAEAALEGKAVGGDEVAAAAQLAADASDPVSDVRGTAEYKKKTVKLLTARAIDVAHRRARSEGKR